MDTNNFLAYMLRLNSNPFIYPFQYTEKVKQPEEPEPNQEGQSKKYRRTWKKKEIEAIFAKTIKYCQEFSKNIEELTLNEYRIIGSNFPQSPEQIMIKVNEVHQNGTLRPGIWSSEEDNLLSSLIQKGHQKWGQVAKILNREIHCNLKVRSGKQCKERWNNYLNPSINRGPWTLDEDVLALRNYKELGQKWSLISKNMKNRTEGAVKNRIKSLINKIKQNLANIDNLDAGIDDFINEHEKKVPVEASVQPSSEPFQAKPDE